MLTTEDLDALNIAIERGLFDPHKAALCLYCDGQSWLLSAQPHARVIRNGFHFRSTSLGEVINHAIEASERLKLL